MRQAKDLPARERFEYWRELLAKTRFIDIISAHAEDFQADVRRVQLGPVSLLRSSFPPTLFRRTPAMARQSDPDVLHVTLLLDGAMVLIRDNEPTRTFGPGDLHILESSQAFDLRTFGGRNRGWREPKVDAVGVDLPVSMLPLPRDRIRSLQGIGFSGREGMGAVLSDFLLNVDRRGVNLEPCQASRLGTAVSELVTAWLADELSSEQGTTEHIRQRATMDSVRAFIQRNLHDPDLTPTMVAAAHHLSVSHLHRLFGQYSEGETVAAWIRTQRLERARRDLADPALRTTPVHVIAARWGITSASDFSRSFRTAFGVSPSEHRNDALSDPVPLGR